MNRTWIKGLLGIGLLLGVSQLLLGWSMLGMLQQSEDKISRIIDEQVSDLNGIQALTRSAGNVHRALWNLMMATTQKDTDWAQEKLKISSLEVEQAFTSMPESQHQGSTRVTRSKAYEAWTDYKLAIGEIEEAWQKKDSALVVSLRTGILRSRFEALQLSTSEWANATEDEARNKGNQLKVEFSQTRKISMGLALGPMILGAMICAVVIGIFVWMYIRLPDRATN